MQSWEHFHHQADIGVRGRGESIEQAFAQAAVALTAVVTDPATVRPVQAIPIRCDAPDRELLLADWLNALVYEMSTRSMLFARFELQIVGSHLSGSAWGEPVESVRHHPAVEVKGATYTELRVTSESQDGWVAQAVVDV